MFNPDKNHDFSGSEGYLTPSTTDLYRAPRPHSGETWTSLDGMVRRIGPHGSGFLSEVSARIDVREKSAGIGDSRALTIFSMARKLVAESVVLN